MDGGEDLKLDHLPNDCISHILSFTSPRDTCRTSTLSTTLHGVSESDVLWEKFLPPDYEEILTRSTSPVPSFLSRKQLFLWLCSPILVDKGGKMFSLDKLTSKKCYLISARELAITLASSSPYWSWKPLIQSRFAEVAELVTTWWLEINGSIHTNMLSPNTAYEAYLVFKLAKRAYGLDFIPSEVSIEIGNHKTRSKIVLSRPKTAKQFSTSSCGVEKNIRRKERVPSEREDGWLEIWLGEFYTNDGHEKEVKMSFREVEGSHLKGGLIVEGIELRPKK